MKLSILVPVYNEASTIEEALKRLLAVDFVCDTEIIVVDDGSTDGTTEKLSHASDERLTIELQPQNRGKGEAVRRAAAIASGDYIVVFDADLEYKPEELPLLLVPVLVGDSDIVYGTRTFGSHTAYSFWYVVGNKVVTLWANLLFNSWISDLETCYKLMPTSLFRSLSLRSNGFGMEAEITGRVLKAGFRPFEVPISYKARSREEGKKLTWRDGVEALWILLRIRLFSKDPPRGPWRKDL